MANTYTLIASTTLTGSQTTVTFSSIPSTYTDLVLRVSVRTDRAAVYDSTILKFNSTTTGYSKTTLQGDGSTALSGRTSSGVSYQTVWNADGNTATTNAFGNGEIYIPSYTVSQNKPMSSFGVSETNAVGANMGATAGLWQNTTAISTITITPDGGTNFLTNSTFYLYGIKNS